MDPLIGGLIAGGVGGALGLFGQKETNEANAAAVEKTNAANVAIAQEQMRFQERMANTAHQREVADLRAAGLNPILSARGSGAPSPSGAGATMMAAKMENAIGAGVSTARDFANLTTQMASAKADMALKESSITAQAAQTAASVASAKEIESRTAGIQMDNDFKAVDLPTKFAESQFRKKQAELDARFADYDALVNRAETATGVVGNLVPAIKLRQRGVDGNILREHKQMKDYIKRQR